MQEHVIKEKVKERYGIALTGIENVCIVCTTTEYCCSYIDKIAKGNIE